MGFASDDLQRAGNALLTAGNEAVAKAADASQTWQSTASSTTTADVVARAAGAAGVRNYVTDVTLANASAAGVGVVIKDGATVIWQGLVPAGATLAKEFKTPLRGTAATAINVAALVATTTLTASLSGYSGA